ncbi:MAG: class I SAM-dependent methyltransferase [Parachlamydiaceae bacterium]|nr:class I SAM-dependent methyltransferase [Parachlamydiaceae bacterium]
MVATEKTNDEKLKVLLEWKNAYTEALINALKPSGSVLQVGFSSGTAATAIQKHQPKNYTIIVSTPEMLQDAKKWAENHPKTKIIQGDAKTELKNAGSFDVVFYNDYTLEQESKIINYLFPDVNQEAANKAKDLLDMLEEQIPLITMHFTSENIADFHERIGQFNVKELPRFFTKLKENGNITDEQFDEASKKYKFSEIEKQAKSSQSNTSETKDYMLTFLEEALKNNMNSGARFSAFLNNQITKYEDSQFHDQIITNPHISYKEILVPIKTSDKTREGLVMIVEKSS